MHPFRAGSPEADEATLQAMLRGGADLTRETEVIFYLYFPTRELAERAAESIRNPTFVPAVKDTLCEVTARIVPSLNTIRDASVRFHAVAATLHGEYDGWVAEVKADVAPPPVVVAVKWWVALGMYVVGPLRLYRTHRVASSEHRTLLGPADEQAMPDVIRAYLGDAEHALVLLGFEKVARTVARRTTAGGMTSFATLLAHPTRYTIATVGVTQARRGRAAAFLTLKNTLANGRVVLTSNSGVQRRHPRRTGYDAISFPDVVDPAALDRIHRSRVGSAPVVEKTLGDAMAYLAAEEAEARDSWVRAGYYRRGDNGELCPTRRGAIAMVWRGKFPWAQLTRWHDARMRAAIYSRLGS